MERRQLEGLKALAKGWQEAAKGWRDAGQKDDPFTAAIYRGKAEAYQNAGETLALLCESWEP